MNLASDRTLMTRRAVAIGILSAVALPLVMVLLVFGCCVLPIHGVVHAVVPACHAAAALAEDDVESETESVPASPRELRTPDARASLIEASRFDSDLVRTTRERARLHFRAHRSAITLGALRVDDDVGSATLLSTFII